jgi:hypothetical protein
MFDTLTESRRGRGAARRPMEVPSSPDLNRLVDGAIKSAAENAGGDMDDLLRNGLDGSALVFLEMLKNTDRDDSGNFILDLKARREIFGQVRDWYATRQRHKDPGDGKKESAGVAELKKQNALLQKLHEKGIKAPVRARPPAKDSPEYRSRMASQARGKSLADRVAEVSQEEVE